MTAKYATTAIPALVEMLGQHGVSPQQLRAKLVGGAQMFRTLGKRPDALNIGQRNVEMCREMLHQYRIPIVAEDVGGNYGRTVEHFCHTGKTFVKTVFKGESWL
jgi:chemotaxis protein CheD